MDSVRGPWGRLLAVEAVSRFEIVSSVVRFHESSLLCLAGVLKVNRSVKGEQWS